MSDQQELPNQIEDTPLSANEFIPVLKGKTVKVNGEKIEFLKSINPQKKLLLLKDVQVLDNLLILVKGGILAKITLNAIFDNSAKNDRLRNL